ncbi:MAG TPA: NADH-quinone oxidoreductase subunit NuoH [Egibacteraceae bacterium]|nr:NADH-quinone oxidoreductase subunit NuoH [Egibacteraceae bacterium]
MDGIDLLIIIVKVVVAFGLWIVATALLIWGERRLVAKMQTRIGPNRLGPFGLFQTLADGAKLFFKEDITPSNVDRAVYVAAPFVSAVVAMLTFAVVPFGGTFTVAGREVALQVWDPNIGLLWVLAMSSLGVYGIVLAGWSSGSKYPLLGGVRSSAQMISYELGMGLALAAVFIYTGTLQSSGIVAAQQATIVWGIPAWNVIPMIPAFVIFFVAVIAETQRPPFDLPEAEGELVAGFHTEYSGAKFAMFFLAEFMNVITVSAVTVTAFLGGPGPIPAAWQGTIGGALFGLLLFAVKTFVLIFVFVWLRATLPRTRYDRLMDLGWKVMLPFALAWVMITALVVLYRQQPLGGDAPRLLLIGFGVAAALWLVAPMFSRRERDDERQPPQQAPATDDSVDEVQV